MKASFALVLFVLWCGCSKAPSPTQDPAAGSAAVVTDAKAVIALGRELCEGCVEGARTKLRGVAGVGALALNPGGKDLTVHYDSKRIQPGDIVGKLVAAGEADAKLVP